MPKIESVPVSLCKVACGQKCKVCYMPDEVVDVEQVKAAGQHILNELAYIFDSPGISNSEMYLISGASVNALKDTADALIAIASNNQSSIKGDKNGL